jgi:glutamate formiminotransferase/formiminotetrahydrofolate cyclodeaminase
MQPLIECVPNFSNGRDPAVYNAIADSIRAVDGVEVLDVSADSDHNRTVITFVGEPAAVEEAAFQAIATAAPLIDLDKHQGEHPRIGATDVCPFIPIRGVTMAEAAEMARRVGRRVGDELGIAVYLYGAAASRPERESLSAIRKGEYEGWKAEVATLAERAPDFGPSEPRSWGATVIGARPFLIAYNLYLNTSDVAVAEQIARAIRYSSGGLRYVQARGFLVEGQAQVSMNLTNFEKTPVYTVQELVKREAAQRGATVTRAELVGLIPHKALTDSAIWYLQLADLKDDQILEQKLLQLSGGPDTDAPGDDQPNIPTPAAFVAAVGAPTAAPGGGSVGACAGSLAAALAAMVAGLTTGRKRYADVEDETQRVLAEAVKLQQELLAGIAEDAAAFAGVMAVMRDKSLEGQAKAEALDAATVVACEVPLRMARLSRDAGRLGRRMAEIGNVNATSDAAAAAIMARAGVQVAALNVKINAATLADQSQAEVWRAELVELETEAERLAAEAAFVAAERSGF